MHFFSSGILKGKGVFLYKADRTFLELLLQYNLNTSISIIVYPDFTQPLTTVLYKCCVGIFLPFIQLETCLPFSSIKLHVHFSRKFPRKKKIIVFQQSIKSYILAFVKLYFSCLFTKWSTTLNFRIIQEKNHLLYISSFSSPNLMHFTKCLSNDRIEYIVLNMKWKFKEKWELIECLGENFWAQFPKRNIAIGNTERCKS